MLDVNGGEILERGMAMLLCEVIAVENDHVRVRVMNSELQIDVGVKHDEVLGGLVADSELTAFDPDFADRRLDNQDEADEVKRCKME